MAMLAEPAAATHRDPHAVDAVVRALAARFGNRLVTSQAVREQHGNTHHLDREPAAGRRGLSAVDRGGAGRSCASAPTHRVPVIPFGTGTSLEGHVNAPHGGVSIDFRDMNRVLAVHAEDLDCVVEPGITRKALNEYLRDQGLFFPIDPGADASLGGMAATRCSGTNAVRYGTMKDNVLALKVVMANGEVMTTARRAKKSSAGYDLTRLMVGSEGTLGVITELTLKLSGIPEAISGGICPFPSVEACCNATILTIQSGIPVARIELLDALQVSAVNAYSKLTLAGNADAVPRIPRHRGRRRRAVRALRRDRQRVRRRPVRMDDAAGGPNQALAGAPRRRIVRASRCGRARSMIATDVCVPISRLAECVTETQRDIAASKLIAPIVGHVGDGNFHLTLLVDMNDRRRDRARQGVHRAAGRARARDGRHLHRRARRRAGQDEIPARRARRAGAGSDAGDQARARPAGHHESG